MSKDKDKFENVILFERTRLKNNYYVEKVKENARLSDNKFVETICDKIGLDMIRDFAQMDLDMKQDNFTKAHL